MNKYLAALRPRMSARGALAVALIGLASSATAVGSQSATPVAAAAGDPKNPGQGTVLFVEDFENNSSSTVDPPVVITDYVGATGMRYLASPYWSSTAACNGMILASDSAGTAGPDLCLRSTSVWESLKQLSGKLSDAFGGKFTVASYTSGDGVVGEYTQIKTKTPVSLPAGGAYLTMAVDTAAYNCGVRGPSYYMSLIDPSGAAAPVLSTLIDPCKDPDRILDGRFGKDAYLVRTVGDTPALIDASSVVLNLENQNISGRGNDATIDNLTLYDVSPQLDKEFDPPTVQFGSTATARFIITNTYSPNGAGEYVRLDAKPGWQFSDTLPVGLRIVGTPRTGAGAEACANFNSDGSNAGIVAATGDLVADQAYCVVEVDVTADAPGSYTNLTSDVTTIGVKPPDPADVTFVADPKIALVKSAIYGDANGDGVENAGDTIQYSFVATNLGNVALDNLVIDDPVAGTVTCDVTTIPVGGSVSCLADNLYVITQGDVDQGLKYNSATATGVNTFDPTQSVTASDDTNTLLNENPSLNLVKSAAAPVDANSSGLTDAGDTIQYSFIVTNTGNVTMTGIRIDDPLAGAATCDTTTLAPGAAATCQADSVYTITEGDEMAGKVANTATAFGVTPSDTEVPSNTDTTVTPVQTPAPSLLFEKFAAAPVDANSSGLTDAGDTIQYTFIVTNNGNVPISGITVTDDLAGAVTCESTTLNPGTSTACKADAVYTISDADQAAGSVHNVAFAGGKDPDGGAVTSIEDDTTTPVDVPATSLLLEKFAGAPVDKNNSGITDAGDTIRFSFTVTNNGNVPLTGIAVNDPLVGSVTCAATELAPGASTDCVADADYVITEADETAGAVLNVATSSSLDPNGAAVTSNEDNTQTPVIVPNPQLQLKKEALDAKGNVTTGPVGAGTALKYRFTVTNIGNVIVKSISITDAMIGASTCEADTLAPGESTVCTADKTYTVTAADVSKGGVTNTAIANGVDPDGAPVLSPQDSVTVRVVSVKPPVTGGAVSSTVTIAVVFIAWGGLLLMLSRRRSQRHAN